MRRVEGQIFPGHAARRFGAKTRKALKKDRSVGFGTVLNVRLGRRLGCLFVAHDSRRTVEKRGTFVKVVGCCTVFKGRVVGSNDPYALAFIAIQSIMDSKLVRG
jgi:hypothetical protein